MLPIPNLYFLCTSFVGLLDVGCEELSDRETLLLQLLREREECIQQLTDEIARLKGEKEKPLILPSRLEPKDKAEKEGADAQESPSSRGDRELKQTMALAFEASDQAKDSRLLTSLLRMRSVRFLDHRHGSQSPLIVR